MPALFEVDAILFEVDPPYVVTYMLWADDDEQRRLVVQDVYSLSEAVAFGLSLGRARVWIYKHSPNSAPAWRELGWQDFDGRRFLTEAGEAENWPEDAPWENDG